MRVEYFRTTETPLAIALATLGVPFRNPEPISRVISNGKERLHYWFSTDGADSVKTEEIAQAWGAGISGCDEMADKLPGLPWLKRQALNRETLLDAGFNKCRPMVLTTLPNGATLLADKHLSEETKRQVADLVL